VTDAAETGKRNDCFSDFGLRLSNDPSTYDRRQTTVTTRCFTSRPVGADSSVFANSISRWRRSAASGRPPIQRPIFCTRETGTIIRDQTANPDGTHDGRGRGSLSAITASSGPAD